MQKIIKVKSIHPVLRSMAAIFAAVLLCVICSKEVSAADGECGDGVKWNLSGGVLHISGQGSMYNFEESSMAPWQSSCEKILVITIENGVKNIGDLSFYGCTELKSISIPSSVSKIGDLAFAGCKNLINISLPDGLQSIGENAFARCEALQSIRLPNTLLHIGYQAFYNCSSLTSIRVPQSVSNLGASVFAYCTSLMQAVIDCPIPTLPRWTFYGCTSLKNVSLSPSIRNIGQYAFYDCGTLENAYHSGDVSDRETISEQIQTTVPGFSGVTEGESSNIDSSTSEKREEYTGGTVVETQKEVIDTEDSIINITINQTKPVTGSGNKDIIIDATIENENGWEDLIGNIGDYIKEPERDEEEDVSVSVNVNLKKEEDVPANVLQSIAGKDITLMVSHNSNMSWQINGKHIDKSKMTKPYHFSFSIEKNENPTSAQKKVIGNSESYLIKFEGTTPFPITVNVPLGAGYVGEYASFCQKPSLKAWEIIQNVVIDKQGIASFYLNVDDRHTEYLIAIGVEGVVAREAYIPEGYDDEYGTLMDAFGNRYKQTGTSSSWGISFLQLNLILIGIIGISGLVVGVIVKMYFKNRQKKDEWDKLRKK